MKHIRPAVWAVTAPFLSSLLLLNAPSLLAQQVINDDVIISPQLCVGEECSDTTLIDTDVVLSVQESVIRVLFEDTSTSTGSDNDWRLVFNDDGTGNNLSNHFSIEDVATGNSPFRVNNSEIANIVGIGPTGAVGMRTNFSGRDNLRIGQFNISDVRVVLEQDRSSGFAPRTFSLNIDSPVFTRASDNERLGRIFSIKDDTADTEPFILEPGAPSNTLYIAENGNIGLGTDSPDAALTVFSEENNNPIMVLDNAGPSRISLTNSTKTVSDNEAETWSVNSNGTLRFTASGVPGSQLRLDTLGNLTILGTMTTAGSTCNGGCDAIFKNPIASIQENAAKMWGQHFLPAVGPTAEYKPFNVSKKSQAMLHELEKAHIYIDQLHARLTEVEARISAAKQSNYSQ